MFTFSHRAIIIPARKKVFVMVKWLGVAMGLILALVYKVRGITEKRNLFVAGMSNWTIGICVGSSPVMLRPTNRVRNPILTARDVSDAHAVFVADPFILRRGSCWYMFFEVFNRDSRKGEIGLATSDDGLRWTYKQIVLAEPLHISYPYVFESSGEQYMIPESGQNDSVRLYRAIHFPAQWSCVATLLNGDYVDTSVIFRDGKWWMFTAQAKGNDTLHLYYADALTGPWIQHPRSPVIKGNNRIARPGGRVLEYNGRMIRYAQDCGPYYGAGVRVFEITKLTTTEYEEHEALESPIVKASGTGWNKLGMHTVDAHQVGPQQWIAAVDGYEKDILFVGY